MWQIGVFMPRMYFLCPLPVKFTPTAAEGYQQTPIAVCKRLLLLWVLNGMELELLVACTLSPWLDKPTTELNNSTEGEITPCRTTAHSTDSFKLLLA